MASPEPESRQIPAGRPAPAHHPADPPRVRLGLRLLCLLTAAVYGVPALIEQSGYAYEKGRARASVEALEKLDGAGAIARASELFRLATQAISPAVVHIQTQTFAKDGSGGRGLGSGVVIDKEAGLVVTNHHVIQEADLITVRVGRQTELVAELVGDDPKTDLAVIRVKGTCRWRPAGATRTGSNRGTGFSRSGAPSGWSEPSAPGSSRPRRGTTWASASATPTKTSSRPTWRSTPGTRVAAGRSPRAGHRDQHRDQPGPPENGGGTQGIGFAIASSLARRVVDQLVKSGKVVRGFLGVAGQPMSPDQARQLNVPDEQGALVGRVMPASPAAKAGLQAGDVITAIDGQRVTDPTSLRNLAFTLTPGSQPAVELIRAGPRKPSRSSSLEMAKDLSLAFFGFNVKDVPPDPTSGSVAIDEVVADTPAARAGLASGQRVVAIGRLRVFSKAEFDVIDRPVRWRGRGAAGPLP